MKQDAPVARDLVLIGGGHAHVSVLRRFGMKPVAGLRLTLVTRDIHTPYSGMLPGFIAGFYDYDDCHIDLGPLARFANARLYHGEVEGLDPKQQLIHVPGRPPVSYDLLSINTGSRPVTLNIPGVREHALVAKPIDEFLQRWQQLQQRVIHSSGEFCLTVVGGGAGGAELALSTQYRLRELLAGQGDNPDRLKMRLLASSDYIMFGHNAGVRRRFERVFAERGIEVFCQRRVVAISEQHVETADGEQFASDAVVWVTSASAPGWPAEAGLAVDERGFIRVNSHLQSVSHDNVFAAGDIAALPQARPKSGVFAVRQGPVLVDNLKAAATGKRLRPYRAQKHFLGLISTGNRYAVASRGNWSYEAAWLWQLKNWIDERFMRNFNQLPEMDDEEVQPKLQAGIADDEAIHELSTLAMRCGGCGAKVGATVLSRVMQRLPVSQRDDVLIGRDAPDDCAMLEVPPGKLMVQSVDYFRAFISDTYTFGAIAANHALGDVFAMGAEAQSVLAIATVPYGREKIVEESLYELMAGAMSIVEPSGAVLAGGHSSEGAELAFGLTVNGLIERGQVMRKGGLQAGDALILTRPIGTGTLFAADMRGKARGRWIDNAIQNMLVSNYPAAVCLREHGATACTDLTGFGLVGHLVEMTRASGVDADLQMESIPLLDGAVECVEMGILSSLQPANLRLRRAIDGMDRVSGHPLYPLLFDPQTAGGLLAGVPAERADDCIKALHQLGLYQAQVIGRITLDADRQAPVRLL